MPEMGVFTSYSDDLKSEEEINEDLALEQQAKRQLQLRKQRQEGLV
jgi:hypothetical protein